MKQTMEGLDWIHLPPVKGKTSSQIRNQAARDEQSWDVKENKHRWQVGVRSWRALTKLLSEENTITVHSDYTQRMPSECWRIIKEIHRNKYRSITIQRLQLKLASLENGSFRLVPIRRKFTEKVSFSVKTILRFCVAPLILMRNPLCGTTHGSEEGVNRRKWQLKVRT